MFRADSRTRPSPDYVLDRYGLLTALTCFRVVLRFIVVKAVRIAIAIIYCAVGSFSLLTFIETE